MLPYQYRRLGAFTYHVLKDPRLIREVFQRWILVEMQTDHQEDPSQAWTAEWLAVAPSLRFSLQRLPLAAIRPREDLMHYETEPYSFRRSLNRRADEREQAMLRGVSAEPLWVKRDGWELIDGYTRYTVLKRHGQVEVYAYVGDSGDQTSRLLSESLDRDVATSVGWASPRGLAAGSRRMPDLSLRLRGQPDLADRVL